MADLISRAAAIEALGERPYNWTDSDAEIAEVSAWESHKAAIENVPTIDAIPVEWMDDRIYDMKRAPLYRRYAEMLLMEWLQEQKEQEAQNG